MRQLLSKLWKDDCGALIATEWVFVATILVLGAITGLVAVRQAILTELHEFANAIMGLDQSYSFSGQSNCQSRTGGSCVTDNNRCDSVTLGRTSATTCCDVEQSPCD